MATTINCDLCKRDLNGDPVIKVEFRDGEHPHAGSTMHKTADCCPECAEQIPDLSAHIEFDDMIDLIKKNNG